MMMINLTPLKAQARHHHLINHKNLKIQKSQKKNLNNLSQKRKKSPNQRRKRRSLNLKNQ
jgi:hypothetical protein